MFEPNCRELRIVLHNGREVVHENVRVSWPSNCNLCVVSFEDGRRMTFCMSTCDSVEETPMTSAY